MVSVLKNERETVGKKFWNRPGGGIAKEGERAAADYWTRCASYADMNASMRSRC